MNRRRERMREWLAANRKRPGRPIFAIAPAAAYGPAKEWPAENYGALIDLLARREDAEVVLVGAPSERAKCEEVAAASKAGAMVAAGHTNIGELIALLSLCDGFIGNDSGCMHLAGALGIPTVAIFGSTNPNRTGPLGPKTRVIYRKLECSPCLARTCRFGHYNCLTQIEPAELADAMAAMRALDEIENPRRLRTRGINMKLKELASKLGLEFRGDGGVEIFAPAPIEAAGPGMIVFVASAKYAPALQSNVSAAITTAELAAGAKCATLISANPYADFARVLEIFFPPYRPARRNRSARFNRARRDHRRERFDWRVGRDRRGRDDRPRRRDSSERDDLSGRAHRRSLHRAQRRVDSRGHGDWQSRDASERRGNRRRRLRLRRGERAT